jgi:hypothetical protein
MDTRQANRVRRYITERGFIWMGGKRAIGLAAGVALASAFGLGLTLPRGNALPSLSASSRAPFEVQDVSRFLLNALLVPALDSDALPLRWVDPRARSLCGANTTVSVNGELLRAGVLVPDGPFDLEWRAGGCRPFGRAGPRFDGRIKLTVFREDWGFSTIVEPSEFHVTSARNVTMILRAGTVSFPPHANDTIRAVMSCAGEAIPCH